MPVMKYCACGEALQYEYGEPYCPECDNREQEISATTAHCECGEPFNSDGKCPECDYLPRPFCAPILPRG